MTDSLIHLRVPAATKGRWVQASRAAGMRLTDWVTKAVETKMKMITSVELTDRGVEKLNNWFADKVKPGVRLDVVTLEVLQRIEDQYAEGYVFPYELSPQFTTSGRPELLPLEEGLDYAVDFVDEDDEDEDI